MKLDIYQARSGKIHIANGSKSTPLTKQQIDELRIVVFEIEEFDFDDYKLAYANAAQQANGADAEPSVSNLEELIFTI